MTKSTLWTPTEKTLTWSDSDALFQSPIWIVELNDGRRVFGDDIIQPNDWPSSWKRLRYFLQDNKHLYPVRMMIRFYDNEIRLQDKADGYYFRFGLGVVWGAERQQRKFIIGHLDKDKVHTRTIDVPELLEFGTDIRDADPNDESLIYCPFT